MASKAGVTRRANGEVLYTLAPETVLWDKMPWETDRAYSYFVVYFNLEDGQRQKWRAYEVATGKDAPRDKRTGRRKIPSNWERYYRGLKQTGGKVYAQYYQLDVDPGHERYGAVYPVPTWAERVAAWKEHVRVQMLEAAQRTIEEEAEQVSAGLRNASRVLLGKLMLGLRAYTPGNETLTELARAFHILVEDIDKLYKILDPEQEQQEAEAPEMDDNAKMREILALLQAAQSEASTGTDSGA